ncbi:NAD(P) transhydrogenase subunit alpha [Cobetia amphilecti]|uniref:NAD(P) transhydrogenase subunit alpha n=1 Tax=Cobetia amphilecti TaxID=1055104 RepID=UPI001C094144|nr:NAD(P) transhydrogenase subunit alpha [Cobetia amphilecti]MBU3009565.1 NAD(P) transhydrogenase subunit alpha [Cobetia amphilecti]
MLNILVVREMRAPDLVTPDEGVSSTLARGECRVALDPVTAGKLARHLDSSVSDTSDAIVHVESGAGRHAHFDDAVYAAQAGVAVVDEADIAAARAAADLVLCVRTPSESQISELREGAVVVALMTPYQNPQLISKLASQGLTSLCMEFVPRISRAQSMDALSSQAGVAGYHAALLAANESSVFFPMLTTAAGTVRPARVVVVGAGVAGLQAIATAKRLGAQVWAYDIRAAAREQVESLGAKMIDTGVDASGEGGYARELTDDERAQQADALARHMGDAHVVISTAAIPGRPSPRIISREMVEGMKPGAVLVDLAAEGGGNCELTEPGKRVEHAGVTVLGPLDMASSLAVNASEMYAKNLFNLLTPFMKDGELTLDFEDAVLGPMRLTEGGRITHDDVRARAEDAA